MNLHGRQIEAFLAVARELHFRRAAERLHISQPALTRLVKSLEEEIGTQLLSRNTRRVELTEAGRMFLQEAEPGMRHMNRALDLARRTAAGESGFISLGVQDFMSTGVFPGFMRAVTRSCPDVAFRVLDIPSYEQVRAVIEGELDIGFPLENCVPATVNAHTVAIERLAAVVPHDSYLARMSAIPFTMLAELPLILWEESSAQALTELLDAQFGKLGLAPHVAHRAIHTLSMFGLVAAGMGIGLHVRSMMENGWRNIAFVPICEPEVTVRSAMIWRKGPCSPAVRRMLDTVRAITRQSEAARP